MIYVNEGYEDYNYLVQANDNYYILTNQRSAGGGNQYETIDVIYQYINPPQTIEGTRQVWSNITYDRIETTSDFWERPDSANILTCVFFIVLLAVKVINYVTEFVERGGIFGQL